MIRALDFLLLPFLYPAGLLLKIIRRINVDRLMYCKKALLKIGVFPIRKHYYEPLFDARDIRYPLSKTRSLPGIDWNVEGQLALLRELTYGHELKNTPVTGGGPRSTSKTGSLKEETRIFSTT